MNDLRNSLRKCIRSFVYAFNGIGYLLKNENNFRYQVIAGIIAIFLGLFFEISRLEWIIIIVMIGLVLTSEAFNTAIEKLCDIIHPEEHAKIGVVKDIAAGAVLLISMAAVVAGIIVFGSRLWTQI